MTQRYRALPQTTCYCTNFLVEKLKLKITIKYLFQLRNKPTDIQYMGDPDLMPIMTYENTILVRILYQISTRLNELVSVLCTISLLNHEIVHKLTY